MEKEFELAPLVGGNGGGGRGMPSSFSPPLSRRRKQATMSTNDNENDTIAAKLRKYFPAILGVVLLMLLVTDSIEIEFAGGVDEDLSGSNHTLAGGHVHITNGGTERAHVSPWEEDQNQQQEQGGEYVDYDSSIDTEDRSDQRIYKRRARTLSDDEITKLETEWGTWLLTDEKEHERPKQDFYSKYRNRDVPRDEFPSNSWQLDQEYVKEFLHQGKLLVRRVSEAILTEYGYGYGSEYSIEQNLTTFEERSFMFKVDILEDDKLPSYKTRKETAARNSGGWTTPKSWSGLQRRILHSIMSEDTFVFAMGGHSAAAGHGNHLQQSYTLQVQKIIEPVFARLGVKHESRNFGNGGLGTLHNGMAAGSIYGPDVDLIMWDSSMTEKEEKNQDVFARQALLGGIKVPALWSLKASLLRKLYQSADVDVGAHSSAMVGVRKAEVVADLEKIPWAVRYMRCGDEIRADYCKHNKYNSTCWIPRSDYTPAKKQDDVVGGRAGWHPGFREHQLVGRTLAFTILSAIYDALDMWSNVEGLILPDDAWHVSDHFDNIRRKVRNIDPSVGSCHEFPDKGSLPVAVCKYPMKGRTEFTPRGHPSLTSIRSIMPQRMEDLIPPPHEGKVYEPPDVFNPYLHPPPGEIDVLAIAELGPDFRPIRDTTWATMEEFYKPVATDISSQFAFLPPGQGVDLDTKGGDYLCDGTYDSFCDRTWSNSCLLSGHNDNRGNMRFDSYSGWILLNLPQVRYGVVIVKFQTWHKSESNRSTDGWTSVNNGQDDAIDKTVGAVDESGGDLSGNSSGNLTDGGTSAEEGVADDAGRSQRRVWSGGKEKTPEYCDSFEFQYAINGTIRSLTKTEFKSRLNKVQRVVEVITLLDDPEFTNGQFVDLPLAVRILGCGRQKVFSLTHVYWA